MKLFSKKAVEYTDDHGDSPESCGICGHFIKPTTCRILTEPVVADGWCQKFYYKPGFSLKPFMFRGEAA